MPYRGLWLWWNDQLARRPRWLNVLMAFAAFMTVVYVPWDLFAKSVCHDEQVWFGIVFRGWAAKLLTIPHWAIWAALWYGLWHMRPWLWPWAALYSAQVTFSMVVWPLVYVGGLRGVFSAVVAGLAFGAVTRALWNLRDRLEAPPPRLRERYGEWGLVTGASSGIGAEMARALARQGMSVVLVARRQDRLAAMAAELEEAHGVETRVVSTDLSQPAGVDEVVRAVADLEIAVLVNNAGFGMAGRFDAQEPAQLQRMIQLNCATPALLTNRLIGGMRARDRGAVIVVGSVAGHQPVPFNGVYGATKAFDLSFGEALWAELEGTGVDVLVLEPGPTETEFQVVAGETAHEGESPARVVAAALDALGHRPSVVSGWRNWAMANVIRVVPRSLTALIAGGVMAQWVPSDRR
jgi:hypothetical protein